MIGLILWQSPNGEKRQPGVTVSRDDFPPFLRASVLRGERTPPAVARRRLLAAGKKLRKLGVTRAVLPEDLPWPEVPAKAGIAPVSTVSLRRTLAADWVGLLLAERGVPAPGAAVAAAASELSGELVRTVTELALRHRYVLLDVPNGGEALCRRLRREYGVSVQLAPQPAQLEAAAVLLLYDNGAAPTAKNPLTLALCGESVPLPPLLLPAALEARLPKGACREQLAASLLELGVLRPGQITLAGGTALPPSQ